MVNCQESTQFDILLGDAVRIATVGKLSGVVIGQAIGNNAPFSVADLD